MCKKKKNLRQNKIEILIQKITKKINQHKHDKNKYNI